jgi:hypothetical protein
MSALTFGNMCLAQTDEEKAKAKKLHREDIKNQPSDAELLTEFLNNCSTKQDKPILSKGEFADLENGKITIKKSN